VVQQNWLSVTRCPTNEDTLTPATFATKAVVNLERDSPTF
jgi:hypothetical protein